MLNILSFLYIKIPSIFQEGRTYVGDRYDTVRIDLRIVYTLLVFCQLYSHLLHKNIPQVGGILIVKTIQQEYLYSLVRLLPELLESLELVHP